MNSSTLRRLLQEGDDPHGHLRGEAVDAIEELHGVDLNQTDNDGSTLLLQILAGGSHHALRGLLACPGLRINQKTGTLNQTAMMQVAGLGADLDVLLAHPGIDPNAADKLGDTVLMECCRFGKVAAVTALLAHKDVAVNAQNAAGRTALMEGARVGHEEIIAMLLAAGCDARMEDEQRWTALFHASSCGQLGVVDMLLPADLTVRDKRGLTAIQVAQVHGHWKLAKALRCSTSVQSDGATFLISMMVSALVTMAGQVHLGQYEKSSFAIFLALGVLAAATISTMCAALLEESQDFADILEIVFIICIGVLIGRYVSIMAL